MARTVFGRRQLEKFNLDHQSQVTAATLRARPGCVLVAVRDYHRMHHLQRALEKTNLRRHDIVVMTVRQLSAGAGEYELRDDQLFAGYAGGKALYNSSKRDFGPRVGFAWDVSGKGTTVIRGGASIAYDTIPLDTLETSGLADALVNTPLVGSQTPCAVQPARFKLN